MESFATTPATTIATSDPARVGLTPSGDGTMWADAEYGPLLRRWDVVGVDAVIRSNRGECLRKLADRENWFLPTPDGPSSGLYLKKHPPVRGERKSVIQFKCREAPGLVEARNVALLADAGIGTMRVVAYGRRTSAGDGGGSFFLTESLDGYEPLDDFLRRRFPEGRRADSKAFDRLIDAAASVARRFHAAGFNHRDFYCCHLFVKEEDDVSGNGGFDIRLIDLQRMQFRRTRRRRWIVKDLAQLAYSRLEV